MREIRLAILLLLVSASVVFAAGAINSGKPVPYIVDDEASAEFLAALIAKSAVTELDGMSKSERRAWVEERYDGILEYARQLAKTLSTFSQPEQDFFWYGNNL